METTALSRALGTGSRTPSYWSKRPRVLYRSAALAPVEANRDALIKTILPSQATVAARIERPGFSYLPRFISADESATLIEFFGAQTPLWGAAVFGTRVNRRPGRHGRRLTRPVYWLGAWQFACLGYYAEPKSPTRSLSTSGTATTGDDDRPGSIAKPIFVGTKNRATRPIRVSSIITDAN